MAASKGDLCRRLWQYKLTVAYNGYRFNGFQKQPSQRSSNPPPKRPHWEGGSGRAKRVPITIQECLEVALLQYVHYVQQQQKERSGSEENRTKQQQDKAKAADAFALQELDFLYAGRTDKGVHALGQVVTCKIPFQVAAESVEMLQGVNSRLPVDISVSRIEGPITQPFHPRHDAAQKQYSYTLKYHRARACPENGNNGGVHTLRHGLLDSPCLWLVPWPLHDEVFGTLCQALSGTHDFAPFVHKEDRSKHKDHVMNVQFTVETTTTTENDIVTATFRARAKGFRRTMVRNLVGFCVRRARTIEKASESPLAASNESNPSEKEKGPSSSTTTAMSSWDQQVLPFVNCIEAAPASGLCLDFVKYDSAIEAT